MQCPHCLTGLKLLKRPSIGIGCPRCGGRWHTFDFFEKKIGVSTFDELQSIARQAPPTGKVCPHCEKKMNPLKTAENKSALDLCFLCKSVWFDFMELETFRTKRNLLGETFSSMRADANITEKDGLVVEHFYANNPYSPVGDAPLFNTPITNQERIRGFPAITYFTMLACLRDFFGLGLLRRSVSEIAFSIRSVSPLSKSGASGLSVFDTDSNGRVHLCCYRGLRCFRGSAHEDWSHVASWGRCRRAVNGNQPQAADISAQVYR